VRTLITTLTIALTATVFAANPAAASPPSACTKALTNADRVFTLTAQLENDIGDTARATPDPTQLLQKMAGLFSDFGPKVAGPEKAYHAAAKACRKS
jgi:hypothetical protein